MTAAPPPPEHTQVPAKGVPCPEETRDEAAGVLMRRWGVEDTDEAAYDAARAAATAVLASGLVVTTTDHETALAELTADTEVLKDDLSAVRIESAQHREKWLAARYKVDDLERLHKAALRERDDLRARLDAVHALCDKWDTAQAGFAEHTLMDEIRAAAGDTTKAGT